MDAKKRRIKTIDHGQKVNLTNSGETTVKLARAKLPAKAAG